jgi:hypothetical protein
MLYCNEELVRLKDDGWKHLEPEFAKIRRMKNPIRIRSTSKIDINKTGIPEPIPSHMWPLQATMPNKNGESETWMYAKSTPKLKDGKLDFSERSIFIQKGDLVLDPVKQTDLAYFVINLSGILKTGLYEVEDLDKKNTEAVEKLGENAALDFYLCSKLSPIYDDHKKLKQLAASWGISNSDLLHIDTLRKNLLDRIYESHKNYSVTRRGIDEFVAEVNGEDVFSEYRSLVQLAKDRQVIGWNNKDKGWYFLDSTTKDFVQPIVFVPVVSLSQKDNLLFDAIRNNAQLFETIKQVIYAGPQGKYASLGWSDLKKMAKDREINTYGMKQEDIIEALVALDASKETAV